MKQEIKIGQTDYTVTVFIPDPASTDGSGKTGLNAAALTMSYTRVETDNDVTVTDVTSSLNDLSALTDAHNDWGVKEVSSTLAPGLYRLDVADAVFASGAWSAVVYVMITSSAAAASPMEFVLVPAAPVDGVNMASGSANAISASVIADGAIDAATFAAGAINAAAIAADAITDAKVAADVTIASVTGAVGSVTGAVGSVTGLTASDVAAIKAKTDNLPIDPADQSLIIAATNAIVADTDDIQARLPAALVGGRMASNAEVVGDKTGYSLSAAGIQAIWDALTSALTTAGSIGKKLADWTIGTAQTGDSFARLGAPVGASISADIATKATPAQVNTEVVDALAVDTYAEPGQGSPGATVTLAQKIGYLYKAWRNRHTQTAAEYALYADDAATKDHEAVVSDNGTTFERGEVSTGA